MRRQNLRSHLKSSDSLLKTVTSLFQVYHGRSEFGIGHVTMVPQHYRFVDFAAVMYMLPIQFCTRKPAPLRPYWNFMRPFSSLVWQIIAIILVLCICLTWLLHRLSGKFANGDAVNPEEATVSAIALKLFRSHVQQSMT